VGRAECRIVIGSSQVRPVKSIDRNSTTEITNDRNLGCFEQVAAKAIGVRRDYRRTNPEETKGQGRDSVECQQSHFTTFTVQVQSIVHHSRPEDHHQGRTVLGCRQDHRDLLLICSGCIVKEFIIMVGLETLLVLVLLLIIKLVKKRLERRVELQP
jgi:hypothetical protein